ncbi:unnamed protein product [Prorocentrum cordatum]|uniref:Uncharacterized protein n=1 Tax=Prorocentrum cordatum TaxID=2364126 RepID=A0ABN9QE84_9DINO|nr:unnamed protein product [Polarella glacialis]
MAPGQQCDGGQEEQLRERLRQEVAASLEAVLAEKAESLWKRGAAEVAALRREREQAVASVRELRARQEELQEEQASMREALVGLTASFESVVSELRQVVRLLPRPEPPGAAAAPHPGQAPSTDFESPEAATGVGVASAVAIGGVGAWEEPGQSTLAEEPVTVVDSDDDWGDWSAAGFKCATSAAQFAPGHGGSVSGDGKESARGSEQAGSAGPAAATAAGDDVGAAGGSADARARDVARMVGRARAIEFDRMKRMEEFPAKLLGQRRRLPERRIVGNTHYRDFSNARPPPWGIKRVVESPKARGRDPARVVEAGRCDPGRLVGAYDDGNVDEDDCLRPPRRRCCSATAEVSDDVSRPVGRPCRSTTACLIESTFVDCDSPWLKRIALARRPSSDPSAASSSSFTESSEWAMADVTRLQPTCDASANWQVCLWSVRRDWVSGITGGILACNSAGRTRGEVRGVVAMVAARGSQLSNGTDFGPSSSAPAPPGSPALRISLASALDPAALTPPPRAQRSRRLQISECLAASPGGAACGAATDCGAAAALGGGAEARRRSCCAPRRQPS